MFVSKSYHLYFLVQPTNLRATWLLIGAISCLFEKVRTCFTPKVLYESMHSDFTHQVMLLTIFVGGL
jgi:hypothetical protein